MTVCGDRVLGPVSDGVIRRERPGGPDDASDEIESVDRCLVGFRGDVGEPGLFTDGKVDDSESSHCLIPNPSTPSSEMSTSDGLLADGG
jgi:hypothetical protein